MSFGRTNDRQFLFFSLCSPIGRRKRLDEKRIFSLFSLLCGAFVVDEQAKNCFRSVQIDTHIHLLVDQITSSHVVLPATSTDIGIDVGHLFDVVRRFDQIHLSTRRRTRKSLPFHGQRSSLLSTDSSTVRLRSHVDAELRLRFWFLRRHVVVHR